MKKENIVIVLASLALLACQGTSANESVSSIDSQPVTSFSLPILSSSVISSPTFSSSFIPETSSNSSSFIETDEDLTFISGLDRTSTGLAPINTTAEVVDETILTPKESGELYTISEAGDYTLTGNYFNGIYISAPSGSEINLTLKNATIYGNQDSTDFNILGKAIGNANKKTKVNLILDEGSTNYIYNDHDDTNSVHVKGDLTIKGKGELSIISGSKSALKASADLKIKDGATVNVKAVGHGLHGEKITLDQCTVNVLYAGKDGIHTEADSVSAFDDSTGFVKMNQVSYSSYTLGDGIEGESFVNISESTLDIKTQGAWVMNTSANCSTYDLTSDDFNWKQSGNSYVRIASDGGNSPDQMNQNNRTTKYALANSAKGIKVSGEVNASGNDISSTSYQLVLDHVKGTFTTAEDSLHVKYGDLLVNDGNELTINSGDDGLTCDHKLSITGENNKIDIQNCYEGLEGANIEINSGDFNISSLDDCLNAASELYPNEINITINGGNLYCNGDGDGIDSNGNLTINGGVISVTGPATDPDSALDRGDGNYALTINGGYLMANSAIGWSETPANGNQNVIFYKGNQYQTGTDVLLADDQGNTVLSTKTVKGGACLYLSSPKLVNGKYKFTVGSESFDLDIQSRVTQVGNGKSSMEGGNQGGNTDPWNPGGNTDPWNPGGGGQQVNNPTVTNQTLDTSLSSDSFTLTQYACTATKGVAPSSDVSYYYTYTDGNAIKGEIRFKNDNTFTLTADGGPYTNSTISGTWSISNNVITFSSK